MNHSYFNVVVGEALVKFSCCTKVQQSHLDASVK